MSRVLAGRPARGASLLAVTSWRTELRRLLTAAVTLVAVSAWDFTHTTRYQIWAADLKPGFIIQKMNKEGQNCYCKVPWASSSSSSSSGVTAPTVSFTYNPSGLLESSSQSSSKFEFHFLTKAPVNGS